MRFDAICNRWARTSVLLGVDHFIWFVFLLMNTSVVLQTLWKLRNQDIYLLGSFFPLIARMPFFLLNHCLEFHASRYLLRARLPSTSEIDLRGITSSSSNQE